VVSKKDRIAERFHRQRIFRKALISIEIGHRTEAQDKVIVFEVVKMVFIAVRYLNELFAEVDVSHVSVKYLYAFQKLSHRADDMRDVEVTRRDLVQHRRKEKEILAVDERDLDTWVAGERFIEIQCRIKPAKATAENEYFGFFVHIVA